MLLLKLWEVNRKSAADKDQTYKVAVAFLSSTLRPEDVPQLNLEALKAGAKELRTRGGEQGGDEFCVCMTRLETDLQKLERCESPQEQCWKAAGVFFLSTWNAMP